MIGIRKRNLITYPVLFGILLIMAIPAVVLAYDGTHTLLGVGGLLSSYQTVGGYLSSIQYVSGYEYVPANINTGNQTLIQIAISIVIVITMFSALNKNDAENMVRNMLLVSFAGIVTFFIVGLIFTIL